MEITELLEYFRALSIAEKLDPSSEYLWRFVCRQYSKKFHTSLHLVLQMSPEHVLTHYYEDQLEGLDIEESLDEILDMIYRLEDPNYDAKQAKQQRDFDKQAEEEEKERLAGGVSVFEALKRSKKGMPLKDHVEPKKGFIDLSYLEREEQSEQAPKE